jgi:hypothetical protein
VGKPKEQRVEVEPQVAVVAGLQPEVPLAFCEQGEAFSKVSSSWGRARHPRIAARFSAMNGR